jgi:hypothetical protein
MMKNNKEDVVMTEEQRYQQKIKIDSERNKCLKGIWDELKDIRQALTAIPLVKSVKDEELADKEKPVEGWK